MYDVCATQIESGDRLHPIPFRFPNEHLMNPEGYNHQRGHESVKYVAQSVNLIVKKNSSRIFF
jgi:hypothetical protein